MGEQIDKGFCIQYSKLSYRRKFVRTLWILAVIPVMFLVSSDFRVLGIPRDLWIGAAVFAALAQAVYTYRKWRAERDV